MAPRAPRQSAGAALLIVAAVSIAVGWWMLRTASPTKPAPSTAAFPRAVEASGNIPQKKGGDAPTAVGPAPNARTAVEAPEQQWRRLVREPASVARDAALADALEQIADADPDLAAELLLGVATADRQGIVAAILIDASRRPEHASRIASEFVRADASGSTDHGYSLVSALSRAGEFEPALEFILHQDRAAAGRDEDPGKWLRVLFEAWARRNPEQARARASALESEAWRAEALRSIEATTTRH